MFNIDQIKKLRVKSGAGIADIKEALEEGKNDEKKAKEILHKKGLNKASKKTDRTTCAGVVESYIHATCNSGATVVLTCETDFVARTQEFKKLAHEIAMQVCAMNPKDVKSLLAQPWIRDESKTIEDLIKEHIAKFGENIKIKEFKKFYVGFIRGSTENA